jgi:hypothetical protein
VVRLGSGRIRDTYIGGTTGLRGGRIHLARWFGTPIGVVRLGSERIRDTYIGGTTGLRGGRIHLARWFGTPVGVVRLGLERIRDTYIGGTTDLRGGRIHLARWFGTSPMRRWTYPEGLGNVSRRVTKGPTKRRCRIEIQPPNESGQQRRAS